ncbi:MAG TPA: hydrolase [Opitutaceae bacterium]|nr:hydrolase [Opitutaceae bacterium]
MDPIALRDLLIGWAEINSGSSHIAGLDRMRTVLAAEFKSLPHATVESVPLAGTAAQALRVVIHPGAPVQILLSGHYDTVYGAHHPFQKCTLRDDGTLLGPGVADMKGGLVTMLAALREFESGPQASRLGFEVLLTPDEETGSVASRPVLEDAARSRQHAFAMIFEPARSNGDIVRARKGTGIFTVTCHGRAAHAGRDPAAGRNAILALVEYLPEIAELGRDLEGVSVNIGNIRGGGAVNIVPDFAEAQVNIRTTRLADEAEVIECLHELAEPINQREGYRLIVDGSFNRPPKEVSPAEERLFAWWQQCAHEVGVKLSWQDVGGGSDGNLLAAAGLPSLDGLGPVGDRMHSPEEYIHVETLAERARIAVRFWDRVASGEVELPKRA